MSPGSMPDKRKTKCYCPKCGREQSSSPDWRFGVDKKGWAHQHQDGSSHTGIWLTDAEAEERFPKSRIIESEGGSCIVMG